MIAGAVNDRWQVGFPVTLARADGSSATVEVMFDCGYNGYLALPKKTIADLQLPRGLNSRVVLADGRARRVA
jgi:predicted aspartyl protease